MNYIATLSGLAIGSRFKKISDQLMKEAAEVYIKAGIDFQPKWFPLFYLLSQHEGRGIMELAESLQISHPALIQIAKELEKANWIVSEKASDDSRKRILKLSQKAKLALPKLYELWRCFYKTNNGLVAEVDEGFFQKLDQLEKQFETNFFHQKFEENRLNLASSLVQIIDYQPEYKKHFAEINIEWISKFFKIETQDLAQLNDPESYIIAKGGRVYFAMYANEIVGTVAAYKDSETTFSVIKMGVRPLYQGLGIGRKLGEHLIEDVQKLGCKYLYLESNQKLTPALTLYKSLGFKEIPIGETPYSRADFKAEMYFE